MKEFKKQIEQLAEVTTKDELSKWFLDMDQAYQLGEITMSEYRLLSDLYGGINAMV